MFRLLFILALVYDVPPANAHRIVSTSPQVTELLYQLGMGEQIVGTPQFSDYPAAARRLPAIGPLFNPGVEKSVRLRPDWIVGDTDSSNPVYLQAMESFGLAHFEIKLSSVDDLLRSADAALERLGGKRDQKNLAARLQSCWRKLKTKDFTPFRFILVAWFDPPVLFARETLLSDILANLGGQNRFPESTVRFPQVSREWLVKSKIDRIYYLSQAAQNISVTEWRDRLWPQDPPQLFGLESDKFSRSTFTPLLNLKDLAGNALPGDCVAL